MNLPYTGEIVKNPEGIECQVLDVSKVSFKYAVDARKTAKTLVKEARGGEKIETKNLEGKIESIYEAKKGDAIFINLHNPEDVYVPGNSDGSVWKFKDVLDLGYENVGNINGGMLVKSKNTAKVLKEAVTEDICIKDAWGKGKHQFLYKGATLKKDPATEKITGIDKSAFDATWEVVSPSSNIKFKSAYDGR